ncbi:hypothetical protein B0H13DRAFT_1877116 [Mycena leptocephala]|nr:hypothetical protein B0H13DRAFT_1877116 [Mycena leptocephala]
MTGAEFRVLQERLPRFSLWLGPYAQLGRPPPSSDLYNLCTEARGALNAVMPMLLELPSLASFKFSRFPAMARSSKNFDITSRLLLSLVSSEFRAVLVAIVGPLFRQSVLDEQQDWWIHLANNQSTASFGELLAYVELYDWSPTTVNFVDLRFSNIAPRFSRSPMQFTLNIFVAIILARGAIGDPLRRTPDTRLGGTAATLVPATTTATASTSAVTICSGCPSPRSKCTATDRFSVSTTSSVTTTQSHSNIPSSTTDQFSVSTTSSVTTTQSHSNIPSSTTNQFSVSTTSSVTTIVFGI